ncbi:sigma 54-interacting transcriptional regulator [Sphingorhabdus arenilitoris]|uniref:DNA-binding transcriptional regulator NtrC n=1 Tax=Sphingorhabdus arenilitoris TaxID=1490041 RepID=A0ABV8RFR9_9SPHN
MKKIKVLLVEDDASIGVVISAGLAAEDIDVEICDSVAMRDVALSDDEYDVMITDVILKDSDGIDSLGSVKERHGDMPIIVISAQNTLDTAVRASEIEAFEYFPKPFDLNDLVIAVKQAAERRQYPQQPERGLVEANMPMVGRSAAMQEVYRMVARLLRNDLSVLILGESGTGKELVAEAIHNLGQRKTGPFVAVNMAAIPAELIEAELFGHEKGAFTGAVGQSIGRFEQAQGGTLFLDEIGDMPKHAQTRLLRALQSGVISRIGGKASIRLDVRIIAATHQNLEQQIAAGKFREDLYYRLNVVPINMPPLRDRPDDIGLLARHFLQMAAKEGLPERQLDDSAVDLLTRMPWRGNVRELKNLMYRVALVSREDVISEAAILQSGEASDDVAFPAGGCSFEAAVSQFLANHKNRGHAKEKIYPRALAAFEVPLLKMVMKQARGNQLKAAALLGINRNTLRKKLTEYGIGANNTG